MEEGYAYSVFPVGMLDTNCYMIRNTASGDTVLIDPGDEGRHLAEECRRQGGKITDILLTHGHADHILGIDEVREAFPEARLYACYLEQPMLQDPSLNAAIGMKISPLTPDILLHDGDEVRAAGLIFRVLETPGHTAGSVCYYLENEKMLFAGDTLFAGSYGRTDFPTGSETAILKSLQRLTDTLPEDVRVFPGHGSFTSIGREKAINPGLWGN